jgi:hypothetical protein
MRLRCREHGTTLVAYSPMCQGLLTGKYNEGNRPSGPRKQLFTDKRYREIQVLGKLRRRSCLGVGMQPVACHSGANAREAAGVLPPGCRPSERQSLHERTLNIPCV